MQENETNKMSKLQKGLLIAGCSLLTLIAAAGITFASLWGNEISSLLTIEKKTDADDSLVAGPVYEMEIKGGYYFDKYLEQGGASNDNELINFIVDNITKGIIPIDLDAPTIGCSAFTSITESGDHLFGRNYDFDREKTTSLIVHTNPGNGRHASISTVDLRFLGITGGAELDNLMTNFLTLAAPYAPLDGMNDAGVACGIFMSYQGNAENNTVVATDQDTEKPDLTSTTMLRMVLDYADSVEEAVELISNYDLHDSATTSFHYMIADKTGKSAILEWVNGDSHTDLDGSKRELKVYYNDDDAILGEMEEKDNFQYITNFLVTPDYYLSDSEKQGLDRYNLIESMINQDGSNTQGIIEDEDYALSILEEVGRRKFNNNNAGITVWSALYNLSDLSVTWVGNEQFSNPDAIFTYHL